MTRALLNNYIRQEAKKLRYTCYEGFVHRAGTDTDWFPALWIAPLQLAGVEGRQERRIKYRVAVCLMHLNDRYTERQKEALWTKMEQDAIMLFTGLAVQDHMAAVRNLSCKPDELSRTGAGELSMNVEFEAELFECNSQNTNE